ncbi:MAG: hypothetical protein K2P84_00225 [Undibacterium sp.]|nr:hypothetical protein [Undibacterium sp.]
MSLNGLSPIVGTQALQAYQQIKQRGEQAADSNALAADARTELDGERAAVGETDLKADAAVFRREEQIAEQRAIERSWGLISAIVGTQVDVFV